MSDTAEKLRRELQAAQRALVEAQARYEHLDTEDRARKKDLEDDRSALLFMLEDLEQSRHLVEQAHREWIAALDRDPDPIFLHDREFRILRCNRSYQQRAGIPFHEIIGQPYFGIFPKTGSPSPICLRCMGDASADAEKAEEAEEEVAIGETIYHARAFSIKDEQGGYLYSMHAFEDITRQKHLEEAVVESEEHFRVLYESSRDAIMLVSPEQGFLSANPAALALFGCRDERELTALSLAAASPEFQPDGRRSDAKAQEMMRLALEKGAHFFEWTLRRVDGTTFPADVQLTATFIGGKSVIEAIVRDITERKRAEEALRESEEKFRKITGSAQDAIIMMGADQRISFWNTAAERIFGYTAAEVLGQELHPLLAPPAAQAAFVKGFRHFIESGEGPVVGKVIEATALRKSGEEFPIELAISATWLKGQWQAIGIVREITERRKALVALQKSEERYRQVIQTSMDGFWVADTEGRILDVNDAYCQLTGYAREELLHMRIPDVEAKETPDETAWHIQEVMTKGDARFETRHRRKDGQLLYIESSVVYRPDTEDGHFFIFLRDITERKQKEAELRMTANRLNEAQHIGKLGFLDWDLITNEIEVSDETLRIYGLAPGKNKLKLEEITKLVHPDDVNYAVRSLHDAIEKGSRHDIEHRIVRADGTVVYVHTPAEVLRDANGKPLHVLGTVQDITERKRTEVAIQHANRALAALGEVNRILVHATDENELLQAACQAIVEKCSYRMAWVGYVQHDEAKSIKIMAHAGHEEGYLDGMRLTWAETERGMGPSGRAVRSDKTQVCQDIANDPQYSPWCDAALQRSYLASIALPLSTGSGKVFGILNVYAEEVNAFALSEINLLDEMAGDLAFGVRSLRLRQERDRVLAQNQQQLVQLRDSMEDTVRAIASIVEMRDPYTSGHQARVADLAAAIAKQMGLPDEQVHAIHLAGVVHDLGKIQIPSEILSKPGRINDIEFSLIKTHAQAGYDILKGIHFPWPIAQMVLQHHERLDGSGYPQGLKGDAILLEARILSVADVVEAMYSHRPYRPGLGLDIALEEITKHRGIYFDPAVVDACLAVFSEHHYSFK